MKDLKKLKEQLSTRTLSKFQTSYLKGGEDDKRKKADGTGG